MTRKTKLAFQILEKEMELLSSEESFKILGGTSSTGGLTPEEWWALNNPLDALKIKQNSELAGSFTINLSGQHNGLGDAARHAYWMACNGRDVGTNKAKSFGIAHEESGDPNVSEIQMDLNNNNWGANFGAANPGFTSQQFVVAFNNAVATGKIQILQQGTANRIKLPPSSSGLIETDNTDLETGIFKQTLSTGFDDIKFFMIHEIIDVNGYTYISMEHPYGPDSSYIGTSGFSPEETWNNKIGLLSSGSDDTAFYYNYSYVDEYGGISTGYYHPDLHPVSTGGDSTGL